MKKATFITIIAALLLLVSCNVDSEYGIYYQVATSEKPSGINIIQALGYEEDDVGIHYFLSDNGICTTGDTLYVKGSQGKNIQGAYRSPDCTYYYSNAEGTVYTLDSDGKSVPVDAYAGKKLDVSPNGFVYNSEGFGIATVGDFFTEVKISNPRFSGSSMFTMDGTTKAKIFYENAIEYATTIEGLSANATGYLEGKSNYFYVFDGTSIYKVTADQIADHKVTLGDAFYKGLDSAPDGGCSTGGYKAVEYTLDDVTYLLIRTASSFTIIKDNGTTGSLVQKNIFTTLNSVYVVDMYELNPDSDDGKIAIVTYANGIRIADMIEKTVSDDIL